MNMRRLLILCCLMFALCGCAGYMANREGRSLIEEGQTEAGLALLYKAAQEAPGNGQYRAEYLSRRDAVARGWLAQADTHRSRGEWQEAEQLYLRIQAIDPENVRAREGLQAMARDRRHAGLIEQAKEQIKAGHAGQAEALLSVVQTENPDNLAYQQLKQQLDEMSARSRIAEPRLNTLYDQPVSVEFREANLKIVLEALARSTGINFVLDKEVRPDLRTTVFIKNASLEDALDLMLTTNKLEKKVLNRNAILIYPATPEKMREYQDLVVRAFYLNTAEAKTVATTLKSLLKLKEVVVDEKLNMLMIRDTPETVRVAEKVIALHDVFEPEVMLEVEVLEVTRSRLLELGVQFPNQLVLTPLSKSGGTSLTLTDLKGLNSDRLGINTPSVTLNLNRTVSDANLLANPRIRAKNHQKASVLIGSKLPVITTTTTSTGFVAENVQYLDVGLKLEVEPNIYLKDQVGMHIKLEVSSVVGQVKSSTGLISYQLGTRNAETGLRLKDGETQVLAGLISDEDRSNANRVPGLGDVPLLGRLFSSQKDDHQKTEIVLAITPHLISRLDKPDLLSSEFWSGTEANLRVKPLVLQTADTATPQSAPAQPNSPNANSATLSAAGDRITPTANTQASRIALDLQGPAQVKIGEVFKVALQLDSNGSLRSLPFQLAYDPTAFQVVSVDEGEYFKTQGGQTSFSNSIDTGAGKIFGGVVRSNVDGAKGKGVVTTLTLKALAIKSQSPLSILAATPIAATDSAPAPTIAAPLVIDVVN